MHAQARLACATVLRNAHLRLNLAHPELRITQQQLRFKDGNGNAMKTFRCEIGCFSRLHMSCRHVGEFSALKCVRQDQLNPSSTIILGMQFTWTQIISSHTLLVGRSCTV